MTLRKFFVGRAIVFIILLILGFSIFVYKNYVPANIINTPLENNEPPIFTWIYEKDTSLNLDGFPNTNIFLEAKYTNGTKRMLIDTIPSGCNDIPDADSDSIPNSTNIQCYGAGLGYRFKIIKGEESYDVMRKKFEETSPDQTPPIYKYELISTFPFNY
jgi:hypothetical protein